MHVKLRSGFQLQIYWVVVVRFGGAPNYQICVPALMKSITWIFIAYTYVRVHSSRFIFSFI